MVKFALCYPVYRCPNGAEKNKVLFINMILKTRSSYLLTWSKNTHFIVELNNYTSNMITLCTVILELEPKVQFLNSLELVLESWFDLVEINHSLS